MPNSVKAALAEMIDHLPDDCTWDDAMYQLYVRQKINDGMRAADEGRLIDHDEVFAEFKADDAASVDRAGA